MKIDNNWYEGIKKQIELLKNSLTDKDYKKYKLRMFICVVERVAQFSPECGQCQLFKQDVSTLSQDVSNMSQMPNKESRKGYFKSMNMIISHLKKQHKLVTEGYYVGMWIGIGLALGLPFGIPLGNISLGMPFGMAIGVAIGTSLDAKAKKEGRVLCPRETTGKSRTRLVLVVILGLLVLAGIGAFLLFRSFT